jgi:alkylation response protein AidB-like acyl-CoA dehydrogenase
VTDTVTAPADDDAALLADVSTWLADNWDPDLTVAEWWERVGAAGWSAPHFPREWGGLGYARRSVIATRTAFQRHGAVLPPAGLGMLMAAPTICTHGTEEQIARLVSPIYNGSVGWCQLFSEPGAGSDLAGLSTRATRDGDHWVISGQKVWSSMAMGADYGMLLARTDSDVPKHAGISWFAFPLDQPGVTIRPLREMTGDAVFNEVFIDDAICADADLIGGEGNGWAVTQTTLFFERTGIGAGGGHVGWPPPGPKGAKLGRRAGDVAQEPVPGGDMIVRIGELVALAQSQGRNLDPHIRQDLVRLHTYTKLGQWNALRARAEAKQGGGEAIANLGKISQTLITKLGAQLGVDILGPDAMLAAPDGVEGGRFANAMVFSPASSIYGGADEIQRNIISERTLGLPREPLPGKGQPYGEFLRSLNKPS